MIIRQNDEGNCAYLVQSGRVRVFAVDEERREIEFARLGPGQIFGEMALVFDGPRSANVQATEDTNLIVITRETFQMKLKKSDPTIRAIVTMMANRVIDTNNYVVKKKTTLEELAATCINVYQNVYQALPRSQQRTFENTILPKLEAFTEEVKNFRERFAED
jgi:CRP-like cAMP-binding protein